MRTLGRPGSVARQARRQLAAGALLVAVGLAAFIGSSWAPRLVSISEGWSLLPLISLLLIAAGARLAAGGWRGQRRLVTGAATLPDLASQLDGRYTLLWHVRVPELRGALAASPALLVGPHGVLVLLVKHLAGSFVLEGDQWWVLTKGDARPWERSPTWEAYRPLRALRRFLLSEGMGDVPVHAAVVLAAGEVQIETAAEGGPQPSAVVLTPGELVPYVQSLAESVALVERRIAPVVQVLEPYVQGS